MGATVHFASFERFKGSCSVPPFMSKLDPTDVSRVSRCLTPSNTEQVGVSGYSFQTTPVKKSLNRRSLNRLCLKIEVKE
jgi:hypothetical protein